MLLFRADPFGGTHELLPCGLLGGDLVELFKKNESKYYWYDFTVRGERYRGSTKETNETRAQKSGTAVAGGGGVVGGCTTGVTSTGIALAGGSTGSGSLFSGGTGTCTVAFAE
jgi:hypothetical protein